MKRKGEARYVDEVEGAEEVRQKRNERRCGYIVDDKKKKKDRR